MADTPSGIVEDKKGSGETNMPSLEQVSPVDNDTSAGAKSGARNNP